MKKTIIIPLVSLGIIAACTSAVLFARNGFNRINADDGTYTIELTAANATGSVVYDEDNWLYRFQISGTTKRDGKPFVSDPNYSYFADYADSGYTYGGDHILVLNNKTATYGNSYIYIFFNFSGPAELITAKAFYYVNDSAELSEEALSSGEGGYYFSYTLPGNSKITLEKIAFKYYC